VQDLATVVKLPMLFAPANRVITTRLERKLAELPDNPLYFEDRVTEFGDCRYLLRCETACPAKVLVCIGFGQDTAQEIDATHDEAVEAVESYVGEVMGVNGKRGGAAGCHWHMR
jgi:hypothetical protein